MCWHLRELFRELTFLEGITSPVTFIESCFCESPKGKWSDWHLYSAVGGFTVACGTLLSNFCAIESLDFGKKSVSSDLSTLRQMESLQTLFPPSYQKVLNPKRIINPIWIFYLDIYVSKDIILKASIYFSVLHRMKVQF